MSSGLIADSRRITEFLIGHLEGFDATNQVATMWTPSGAPIVDTGLDDVRLNGQGAAIVFLNGPHIVVSTRQSDAGSVWLRDRHNGKLFDSIADMVRSHIDLIERGILVAELSRDASFAVIGMDEAASLPLVSESVRARRFRSIVFTDDDPDGVWHLDGEARVYAPPAE